MINNKLQSAVKILIGLCFGLTLFVFSNNSADAATYSRYWIGADAGCTSDSWNDTACWSATDGGTGGVSVPNSTVDIYNVYFTSNAKSLSNCTINMSPNIATLTMNAGYTYYIGFGASEYKLTTTGNVTINDGRLTSGYHTSTGFGISIGGSMLLGGGDFYGSAADINVVSAVTFSNANSEIILATSSPGDFVVGGAVTVATGTFSGGSALVDLNGALSVTTGRLTLSSYQTSVAGNLTVGAYTVFSHNNGSLIFDANVNATITITATSNTIDLYDVTINKSSASYYLSLASGDFVNIEGTLSLTNGTLGIANSARIYCWHEINWGSGFDGARISTSHLGYLVLYNSQVIPAGQTNIPSLLLDNIDSPTMTVSTSASATTMSFYGYLDIANNSNTGGTFDNAGNVNMTFNRSVTLHHGTFNAGSAATVTFAGTSTEYLLINNGTFNTENSTFVFETGFSLDLKGGTFNAADAISVDFNKTTTCISQSGGTLNAPSTTMYVAGDITQTTGTFNHSLGTVVLDGSVVSDISLSSTLTFYDLTIEKSSDSVGLGIAFGDNVNVNGVLSLIRGNLGVGSGGSLVANASIDWRSTFNGHNGSDSGPLVLKTTSNVTIPTPEVGLTAVVPPLTLDATNKVGLTLYTGTNTALTFGGDVTLNNSANGGATFRNLEANADLTFNSALTINAGVFYSGAGDHAFAGNLVLNSGTFYGNTSTFYFGASSYLDINGGNFDAGSGTYTITRTSTGFDQSNGTFTASSGTMNVYGSMTQTGGTFNHNNGLLNFSGSSSSSLTFVTGQTFYDITLNKSTDALALTIPLSRTYTVNGTLTLTNGILSLGSSSEFIVAKTLDWTSTFDGADNTGVLTIKTTSDVTIPSGQTNWPSIKIDATNKNDLVVSKTGDSTVSARALTLTSGSFDITGTGALTFANPVTLNGGTFYTNGVDITVNANFVVSGGTFLAETTTTSSTVTVGGSGFVQVNSGTLNLQNAVSLIVNSSAGMSVDLNGGTFSAPPIIYAVDSWDTETAATFVSNSGTVVMNGTTTSSIYHEANGPLYNLEISKNALATEVTVGANLDINNNLSILDGTLDFGISRTTYVGGDLTNNSGTRAATVPSSGTVVLDGYDQSISGSSTFYRLSKVADDVDTLTFQAGSTTIVTNTATLSGASTVNRLSLRSSSPSTQWLFDPRSTRTFAYLDVQDSNNINATAIVLGGTGSYNSGNNTNWSFGEKYWVGSYSGCSRVFSDSNCWADTSGGAGGVGVPGVTDIAIFDIGDSTDCDISSSVNVSGIRVNNKYSGIITAFNGVTITVGADRYLQLDGTVVLEGATMVNTDNFYVYGGSFTTSGDFSCVDLYYDYFEPQNGSADFTDATSMTVSGHFVFGSNTSSSSGDFYAPSDTMGIGGNIYAYAGNNAVFHNNSGTIKLIGSENATYTYQDPNFSFYNLILDKASSLDTFTVSSDIDIDGDLTITRGTFVAPNGEQIYLAGDFSKAASNATFTAGTSELVLNGTNQSISGSSTFYKFTKNVTGNHTLTFAASSTTVVNNALTLAGTSSNTLYLRSSSANTQWNINPGGTRSVSYVDVQDSNNNNVSPIVAVNSMDNGNNINWDFGFKYWVGANNATWNDTNNWSTTSGGAGGAGVPNQYDSVIFDNANNCAIPDGLAINVGSLNITSAYSGQISGGNSTFQTVRDFTISGGTFFVGNKTLTVGRDLYQNGGSFQGSSTNITVAEDLRITGGTFSAGSGSTFIVNIDVDINHKTGDSNDATVIFADVGTLDINNIFYMGMTGSTGSFTAPDYINVALDLYWFGGTSFSHQNGTIIMDSGFGVTLSTNSRPIYNLVIDKQSPLNWVSLATGLVVSGDLTFMTGKLVGSAGNNITVEGDWIMGDPADTEFIAGGNYVYFNGSYNMIIGSTTFNNLTKIATTSGETLVFDSNGTQVIEGTLNLSGLSETERLSIRSNTTAQAEIDPQGSRTIAYLDVKDNYNINATVIDAVGTGSYDSGNNTGWNFSLMISGWTDSFSTLNSRMFTGIGNISSLIYSMVVPYLNSWNIEVSITGSDRIRSSTVFNGVLYLGASDGKLYTRNNPGFELKSDTAVSNGQFVHIAGTFNSEAGGADIYLNGDLDAELSYSSTLDSNSSPIYVGNSYGSTIGGNNSTGEEFFEGKLDELRFGWAAFTSGYLKTTYNNMNSPSEFVTFGTEEEYNGQGTGTGELPSMGSSSNVNVRGEIGAGSIWITANGDLTDGIRLGQARVSNQAEKVKWLYDEGTDYISFGDSASPDGFRLQLYMVSEDGGNFVYSGTSIGQFNIPAENFVVYGNYDALGGVGQAPSKAIDDPLGTLNIDPSKSCSEALDLDNYIFHEDLTSGDFGMSLSGVPQDYLRSSVPCITEGTIDLRAFELLIPPSCAEGGYNSTLYLLIVNGDGL